MLSLTGTLTYADMVHAHVAVVNTTKAKLGADVADSDARHGQVVLQAAQLLRGFSTVCHVTL